MRDESRDGAMDLLRVIATLMVLILHINLFLQSNTDPADISGALHGFINIAEAICCVAVNLFVLQAGYFGIRRKKITLSKPVLLLAALSAYKLTATFLAAAVDGPLKASTVMTALVPANYYVVLYVALYALSPYLNALLNGLDKRQLLRFDCLIFALFSVWNTVAEIALDYLGAAFPSLLNGAEAFDGYSTVARLGSGGVIRSFTLS